MKTYWKNVKIVNFQKIADFHQTILKCQNIGCFKVFLEIFKIYSEISRNDISFESCQIDIKIAIK